MLPVPASTRSQHPVPPHSDSRPAANTVTQPSLVTSRSARNTTPAIPIRLVVTLRNAPHPVRPLATSNRAYPRWADSPLRTPLSFNHGVPFYNNSFHFSCVLQRHGFPLFTAPGLSFFATTQKVGLFLEKLTRFQR